LGQLAAWLEQASPTAPALRLGNQCLNYRQLRDRAGKLAQQFRPTPGAVLMPSAATMAELALQAYAASIADCAFLPPNPAWGNARRSALQRLGASPDSELLIATSGTEGEAKAVMLRGANLRAAAAASRSRLPIGPGDVWLNCLPLYHIGGMAILHRCAEAGATVLLHEGFEPLRVLGDLAGVTHLSLVPAMLARLLEAGQDAPPPATLKQVLVGGGPLSATLAGRARRAGWPLRVSYGMSETGSQLATLPSLPEDWQPGQVGLPLPGFALEIRDEQGQPTTRVGRIHVRGNAVMAGYANPAGQSGQGLDRGWFASGDLGSLDAQGRLTVLGRHDDLLVSGGVNVHPQAVEEALKRCPGVEDAALTAIADEVWGDLLVAVVVGDCSEQALASWCREQLPSALRPRRFAALDELPRNALGKLERRALRTWAQQNLS
jgi:O-succinylbenzoic acid--CoA ligase